MRILGLDYGDKTVGVAVSDETRSIATALEIIRRDREESIKKSVKRISELLSEFDTKEIVLGYPKNMDNTEGFRCQKTIAFKERLERNIKGVHITLWDERLSTAGALRGLRETEVSGWKADTVIDKFAAAYILQGYLDMQKNKIYQEDSLMSDFEEKDDILEEDEDLEGYETVVLVDEDGEETAFAVLDVSEHNGVTYLLVIEEELLDDEEAEGFILKCVDDNDDEVIYEFIDDDEEFEMASKLFEKSNDDFEIES